MGQRSISGGEFFWDDKDALHPFKTRETLVEIFDDAFIERLNLDVCNQRFSRNEVDLICARPIFESGEVRCYKNGGKLPSIAEDYSRSDKRI